MKNLKKIMTICLLFSSPTLYAESSKDCMNYWNQPVKKITVLDDVECDHIWEFGKNKIGDSRLKILESLDLEKENEQWQSIGECQQVLFNKKKYHIYNARYKEYGHNIWLIYDNKNAFAYFRKVNSKDQSVDLSCAQEGKDSDLKFILNTYLKTKTSVSMKKYRAKDWHKEQ